MEDKNYVYDTNIISSIEDISNKYSDMLKNIKKSIEDVGDATISKKILYMEEINKFKDKKPLIDLLPFDYLGPLKGVFYERAHTMILAFLLDPKCSGRFAKHFLKIILNEIGERDISQYKITKVSTENTSLKTHDTGGMPDITIKLHSKEYLDIIIENKCMANESRDQTPKYVRGNRRKGFKCKECIKQKHEDSEHLCEESENEIYLFIDYKGRQATCPRFKSLNYDVIKKSLEQAMTDLLRLDYLRKDNTLYSLIYNYISTIDVMDKDESIVSYTTNSP